MAKKTTNSAAVPQTGTLQEDAPETVTSASDPSGENRPDGTNTASESGDAAGPASAEPVKPLGDEPTEAIAPEAATPSMPGIPPEVEASASGDQSSVASQGGAAGGVGAAADVAGLTTAQADAIVAHILGIEKPPARRWFRVLDGRVRHNNTLVKANDDVHLTQAEHARLVARDQVLEWELGDE